VDRLIIENGIYYIIKEAELPDNIPPNIQKLVDKHNIEQIKMGMEIEQEHNKGETDVVDSKLDVLKVALAHLEEDPEYYTHLKAMEKKYIKESPDVIRIKSGKFRMSFSDGTAFPFGYTPIGMAVGEMGSIHTNSIGRRDKLKYPGRFWADKKIISFWTYPDKQTFKYIIDELSKQLNIEIWDDPEWNVEIIKKDNGDISAPEGSTIIWKFDTKSVDDIQFIFPASTVSAQKFANGFGLKRALKNITSYAVVIGNKEVLKKDTMRFAVNMLPDQAPSIFVKEFKDSARNLNYYAGDIADDYGFTKLQLAVEYEANGKRYTLRYNLPLQGNKNQSFQTPLQPYLEKIPVGTKASYFFEVFDNDVVNGFKSSRSELFSLYKPTLEQQSKAVDAKTNAIKSRKSVGAGKCDNAIDIKPDQTICGTWRTTTWCWCCVIVREIAGGNHVK
jgi:hypothetical protein